MARPSTGSVFQRGDGRWCAVVTLNSRRITRYARTKSEARQRLKDLLQDQGAGLLAAPTHVTVSDWFDQWLGMRIVDIRPSTLRTYRDALKPFRDLIGHSRLDRLTPAQVSITLSTMRRKKLGSRRIQQSFTVLSNVLSTAVRLRMIPVNPLQGVDKPRHQERRREYWSQAQFDAFIMAATVSASRYAPLFVFLVSTGLRISEALALRWSDVEWQAGTFRVERALVFTGNRATIQAPKSTDGRRIIVLPAVARDALQVLPRTIDDGPIFVTRNGTTPRPMDLWDSLQALCKKIGVPPISTHGLRHVNAALLAASGVDPHTLRQHLGHATISMSLNRYAYAIRSDHAAAAAFDRAVGT